MSGGAERWDDVYATKGEAGVSWFQPRPIQSLRLIKAHATDRAMPIIDVGGGASRLVDELFADGYSDLTVLDVSATALDTSMARLGQAARDVAWITADITHWRPSRTWGVWHDRAVFHFLTLPADQDAYLRALEEGTRPGSTVIIATFALDGPERCSGLPVHRYSPETLQVRLGEGFLLEDQATERHTTPSGAQQSFSYAVFSRR